MLRGSSPISMGVKSSMAPVTARVFHSSDASPQPNRPAWSVMTFTKIQLRISALTTMVLTSVIFIGERKCKQHTSAAGQQVLPAVEFISDRRASDAGPGARMPKGLAVAGIQGKEITLAIGGEGQSGIRRQHSPAGASRAKFMAPANLTCLVIDGLQHALAPQPIIGACPTVGTVRRLVEIEAVGRVGTDDKQAGLRIETRRTVVSESSLIRCNQAAIRRGVLGRIWSRLSPLVHARCPIDRPEGN